MTEIISTPSNSADPQMDILSSFLNNEKIPDAQTQAKQSGGVPVESQVSQEAEYEQDSAPAPEPASAPVQPVKEKVINNDMSLPQDIIKKQKIEVDEEPVQQQQEQADEPVPKEVAQRGKKGVDAWTAAKREAKQYKQQLDELQQKLKSVEESSGNNQELEELKARIEESEKNRRDLEERLGQVDIVYSNTFKETFDKPINNTFVKSIKLLVNAGVDQKTARDIVTKTIAPDNTQESIQDIIQDFPPAIQGALYQNALDMIEGQKRRAAAIKDWKSTRAAMKEEEKRSIEVKTAEIIAQNVESAIENIRNEGSWLYTKSESDDNWNSQVEERINAVKGLMKTATPDVLAKYVADGIASKTYRQMYEKQLGINSKLKKELTGRVRSRPSLGGFAYSDASTSADKSKPLRADDWLNSNLNT